MNTPAIDIGNLQVPTEHRRDADAAPMAPKGFKPHLLEEYPPKEGYTAHKNWLKQADYTFELAYASFPTDREKIMWAA